MNRCSTRFFGLPMMIILTMLTIMAGSSTAYLCGDTNGDSSGPDIADLTFLVNYLFLNGAEPVEIAACNVNGSSSVAPDISDLTYLVAYLFHDGANLACSGEVSLSYPIVGTNQSLFFDASSEIAAPSEGEPFFGQNAQYPGPTPWYTDNGDGTITDNVTGLMWSKTADMDGDGDIDAADKQTYDQALDGAASFGLAGYTDWRLPTIKELYSLIVFSGIDPSGYEGSSTDGLVPFIDTDYFTFAYGDTDAGERIIDAQYASSTMYVDAELLFGVNFADGRIKGYGLMMPFGPGEKTFFVAYVRGDTSYGVNDFVDNGDSTITDNATGLMWMQNDSRTTMNWEFALDYAENLDYGGYTDWRLPNVKELQSIVDYSRSPGTTGSAAIDPLFACTEILNEAGQSDFGFYWSSTTHENWSAVAGGFASYVSFGRAMGYMEEWTDVHGAGAQRSDPKAGDPSEYPYGHGPQGDAIRIFNYVRCVRDID